MQPGVDTSIPYTCPQFVRLASYHRLVARERCRASEMSCVQLVVIGTCGRRPCREPMTKPRPSALRRPVTGYGFSHRCTTDPWEVLLHASMPQRSSGRFACPTGPVLALPALCFHVLPVLPARSACPALPPQAGRSLWLRLSNGVRMSLLA